MEEQEKPTDKFIATAGEIIETYRDLIGLTVVENVTLGVSVSIVGVLTLVFGCFVVLFGAVGAAWWIGEAMNNMKAGFFITGSAFLLILLIILMTAKKGLIPFIQNMVIKKIYEKISNHHDLVTERERLQQKLTLLKRELSAEVAEIKVKLQPVTKILGLFGAGVPNPTEPQSLLKRGANFGIDMLVGPRLAKAGWLARILVPPLLRGISSSVINKVKKLASKAA